MSVTRNFIATAAGVHVASGPGNVTLSSNDKKTEWLVTASSASLDLTNVPVRHNLPLGQESMNLVSGEHVWVLGTEPVAVLAEVPGTGYIGA